MRVTQTIGLIVLLASCSSDERGDGSTDPSSESPQADSPALWSTAWEAQKARYGGEAPTPQEIRKTGRRVFFLRAERAVDTKRRLYSIRAFDAIERGWKLYESFDGVLKRLAIWEDRAAIYYFPPDTATPPAFTYTEFSEIEKALSAQGYEFILHGG